MKVNIDFEHLEVYITGGMRLEKTKTNNQSGGRGMVRSNWKHKINERTAFLMVKKTNDRNKNKKSVNVFIYLYFLRKIHVAPLCKMVGLTERCPLCSVRS